ncbi:hypothetical protein DV738_g2618, partial [Chaetothyriales sp. CBS 135597]
MSRATKLAALFDSLAGRWILLRELQSTDPSDPSGSCHGTASFSPREPSPVMHENGKLEAATAELLYEEEGHVELSPSVKFAFSRKYVWCLNLGADSGVISVWFTKPGTDTIDYMFHQITVDPSKTVKPDQGPVLAIEGSGGHLCVDDFYHSTYTFYLSGSGDKQVGPLFSSFQTVHEVRGPRKDQLITTQFTRA